jgi:hypothetical protein
METVISIYLMGCDLSGQKDFKNYSTILSDYKRKITSCLSLHFLGCADVVNLVVSFI